jgi:rhamnose utilization protein RhaD (predicted bifunctional aldolase and dehydrogenase)/NAD(P)-dependent dehydrogenase (short-subunit alcohol dehydrogenase family)
LKNLWTDAEASQYTDDLGLRVYTSRLLGRDPALVLHGGGNTSVKLTETNLVGEEEEILYVKGSGWDLVSIEKQGFTPVRMAHMLKLARLETLSDPQMVNELKTRQVLASAPAASVETILHAALPFKYVDHTHADAVVTITNTPGGEARIREIYGKRVVIVPYVMPGFDLARDVARLFAAQATAETEGMVLMNHGIFSFGDTARESYERMIDLVGLAEQYIVNQGAAEIAAPVGEITTDPKRHEIAQLRRDISQVAQRPMLLHLTASQRGIDFARRGDVADIACRGPVTPDHVIRTKRVPMIGRDVAAYSTAYRAYFEAHEPHAKERKAMLDPAPRVVLDSELGLCAVGKTMQETGIIADIYAHTMDCILQAEQLGGWRALPEADIFDMEYWVLEQAKLGKTGNAPAFQGEIALVTGAASGIGKACVEAFLARGAAVIGLDLDPAIATLSANAQFLGIGCDVTDENAVREALEQGVRQFGGIDMLVLNAGIFPSSTAVAKLSSEAWRKVFAINVDANLALLRDVYPLLRQAPNKGRVVVIGSKNVPAPGPGAAAYSASKAALNQLMRVIAMEWGSDGIRINALHPNAVFDTAIWTPEILAARANHYGLTVEQYKTNNVLGVEISSRDVAELAVAMCGPLFAKTTAAQVPVDGGNDRVI